MNFFMVKLHFQVVELSKNSSKVYLFLFLKAS